MSAPRERVILISGNTDITDSDFKLYYVPAIRKRVEERNCRFIMGGARGVDEMAQVFIHTNYPGIKITVYDRGDEDGRHFNGIEHRNGFLSYQERDKAMTAVADDIIAYMHPCGGDGSTFANLLRVKFHCNDQSGSGEIPNPMLLVVDEIMRLRLEHSMASTRL